MNPPPLERAVRPPWGLARLVMRRAATMAALVLLLAAALGLWVVEDDIRDEVDAGMHLAQTMAALAQVQNLPVDEAAARLRALHAQAPLRHLTLEVLDAKGAVLLARQDERPGGWQGWLLDLHQRWLSPNDARVQEWTLRWPEGTTWQVRLHASHEGERQEGLANLAGMLSLLLLCIVGLLVSMRWNLHHALRPLGRLVQGLEGIGCGDAQALAALPAMPVRELDLMHSAAQRLAASLHQAQEQRRALSRKMLTLQEAERAHLAHELHDELGQHLTALRVQAAHLLRRQALQAVSRDDLLQVQAECELLQRLVRSLLVGLQPFGQDAGAEGEESLARLESLLQALVLRWSDARLEPALRATLVLDCLDGQGRPRPWPQGIEADELRIPLSLAQVIYRISQESLTNVAGHARALAATLQLNLAFAADGSVASIAWTATDDGVGIADVAAAMRRGNGLAGINQRVWAVGGDLEVAACQAGAEHPGLRLSARFSLAPWPGGRTACAGRTHPAQASPCALQGPAMHEAADTWMSPVQCRSAS